ncbi:MAG: phosphatidylserine/phosphatidylglycerophosphate/cardiolipin synthase family protein [Acidobacteria bacterium]|nr:phosphatidylserine/phosphatidylglycerophosphate/cardiolipin synthase family protein [Acidobacteriota bacterium]
MCRRLPAVTLMLFVFLACNGLRAHAAQEPQPPNLGEIERLGHAVATGGNSVRLLLDPARAFEARLELIHGAKHHIFLSVPIWRLDRAGMRFLGDICSTIRRKKAADPRFAVFVELDRVTFLPSHDWLGVVKRRLREAGAKVRFFNPGTWVATPIYAARQHDKVLIVDGVRAILGGRNIGDEYFDRKGFWTDLDVMVEGPAVQELQMDFLKTWVLMGHWNLAHNSIRPEEALRAEARNLWRTGYFRKVRPGHSPLDRYFAEGFFPALEGRAGNVRALVLYDNPLVFDEAPTLRVLLRLVAGARRELDLVTPYATLPHELSGALGSAARRGVRVRLITSSETHHNYGEKGWLATLEVLANLAAEGVAVYTWAPDPAGRTKACVNSPAASTLLHAKFVRIDDEIAVVHSSNFNYRSSYYNTEAGIVVFDSGLNRQLREIVDGFVGRRDHDDGCTLRAAARSDPGALWRQLEFHRNEVRDLEDWSFMQ